MRHNLTNSAASVIAVFLIGCAILLLYWESRAEGADSVYEYAVILSGPAKAQNADESHRRYIRHKDQLPVAVLRHFLR